MLRQYNQPPLPTHSVSAASTTGHVPPPLSHTSYLQCTMSASTAATAGYYQLRLSTHITTPTAMATVGQHTTLGSLHVVYCRIIMRGEQHNGRHHVYYITPCGCRLVSHTITLHSLSLSLLQRSMAEVQQYCEYCITCWWWYNCSFCVISSMQ